MKKYTTFLLGFCLLFSASALAHKGATGIVKDRMDNFKASQQALKQIFAATKGGDVQAVVPLAEQIKVWAEKMPDYFPAGSNQSPSEAAAAIWTDFGGFSAAAARHGEAASGLITAAGSGDIAATAAAAKQLADTCKSCHQRYRAD